jgi:hypothetical protein
VALPFSFYLTMENNTVTLMAVEFENKQAVGIHHFQHGT